MPTDSLRMARIHPGRNGPPPPSNVIPEPAQNRVKDFLPLGCCGACRANLSYRLGKNPNKKRYKPFPCESDSEFYQKVIPKLQKVPRGTGKSTECKCFMCECEPAHTFFKSIKLNLEYQNLNSLTNKVKTIEPYIK